MNDLIKNIVNEVDASREQMFKILENIAVIEINKDPKKFNNKRYEISMKRNGSSGSNSRRAS